MATPWNMMCGAMCATCCSFPLSGVLLPSSGITSPTGWDWQKDKTHSLPVHLHLSMYGREGAEFADLFEAQRFIAGLHNCPHPFIHLFKRNWTHSPHRYHPLHVYFFLLPGQYSIAPKPSNTSP